jgi:hypothetical protein
MILVDLLPLIIAAALLPLWIIISLLLLRGEGGVRRAMAFSAGAMTARIVYGLLFSLIVGASADAGDAARSGVIKSTLLLVLGILMLALAYKKWRKEDDPDAPPPKWMAMLSGMTALKAFGFGALLMTIAVKQWVFTFSAIATISEAQLDQVASALVYVFFVVAAQSLMLAPIVVTLATPAQSAKILDTALGWLERNNRPITVAASLIFGVWFAWQGITGILA